MFFHKDYAAPGPGVDPDAPEKTGPARLWEIIQLECGTLFKLNLLFLLSCIPILTIPPAVFAMNQVVRRMILDQPVDCFYHYRTAFRQGWKRGWAAFLLAALPLACSGYGAYFYLSRAGKNFIFFLPFMLCSTIFLAALLASPYFYGVMSTGASVGASLRLSLILGIGKPLRAVLAVLSCYGLVLTAVLALPISALYCLMIGFSFPCLLSNFYIRTVLKQYCGG